MKKPLLYKRLWINKHPSLYNFRPYLLGCSPLLQLCVNLCPHLYAIVENQNICFSYRQDESQKLSKKMQEKAGEWDTLLSNSKNTSESSSNEDLITGQ